MPKPTRLDAELVRRGLATSRAQAKQAIEAGRVLVKGIPAGNVSKMVGEDDPISLAGPAARFVSRGGEKLDGALSRLDVHVEGRCWLDLGASTGGFTDRLLQGGARLVIALDVGYGQLEWGLRNDPRVHVLERVNARHLTPELLPERPSGVTADLSFISITVVLPSVVVCATEDCDYLLMVKPQFEVGKGSVGKGGVVRDPALWRGAIERVVTAAQELGLGLVDAAPSPLPGPAGNREFFVHLRRGVTTSGDPIEQAVAEAS
jgi:23S rRNA (cytidine1920-2'-O)/16S rRNA (cytidine1409-2'-O)-methyltransferase